MNPRLVVATRSLLAEEPVTLAGSTFDEIRKTLLSQVTFSCAKSSRRSPHNAHEGVGRSNAAAMTALPEAPFARRKNPECQCAIGRRMREDRNPQVPGSHVEP